MSRKQADEAIFNLAIDPNNQDVRDVARAWLMSGPERRDRWIGGGEDHALRRVAYDAGQRVLMHVAGARRDKWVKVFRAGVEAIGLADCVPDAEYAWQQRKDISA